MAETTESAATTVVISNVPVSLAEAMKRISDAGDRSLSAEVRRAMREYVEAYESRTRDRGVG